MSIFSLHIQMLVINMFGNSTFSTIDVALICRDLLDFFIIKAKKIEKLTNIVIPVNTYVFSKTFMSKIKIISKNHWLFLTQFFMI